MKKFCLLIGLSIIFLFCTIVGCSKNPKRLNKDTEIKVYSFNGENEKIKINDGVIIITSNKETFKGGHITYVGEQIENIKSYSTRFYIIKDGFEDTLLCNSYSVSEEDIHGMIFPKDLNINNDTGKISSDRKMISSNTPINIKENLYFSLKIIKTNGESISSTIKLNVSEVMEQ